MRSLLITAFILGGLAVALGAFGAHGLKPQLSEYQLSIFEKGVQYQFYHSLAIGLCALLLRNYPGMKWVGRLFLAGVILFSGSLYLLACRDLLPFGVQWAGPVTPLGGLSFIAAWVYGLIIVWRSPQND